MMASSVHAMLLQLGSVLGISGFFHSVISQLVGSSGSPETKSTSEKTAAQTARYFTAGLVLGGAALGLLRPWLESQLAVPLFDAAPKGQSLLYSLATGALVGLGTKLGSGCTSGHFLCGLSRLSPRSIVATATFFSVAVLTHVNLFPASMTPSPLTRWSSIPLPGALALSLLQLPALAYYLVAARTDKTSTHQSLAAMISAFAVGLHFAFGLGMSGMLVSLPSILACPSDTYFSFSASLQRPSKVLGFLSLSPSLLTDGSWDPSLAMVAVGGILPASYGYFTQVKPRLEAAANDESKPLLGKAAPQWRLPAQPSRIDGRLVFGSALFGVGWGATGLVSAASRFLCGCNVF